MVKSERHDDIYGTGAGGQLRQLLQGLHPLLDMCEECKGDDELLGACTEDSRDMMVGDDGWLLATLVWRF